jgi:hypothetical protein
MMQSSFGTLVLQVLAIALCAWGIVVVLQVGAMAGAAILGYDPRNSPVPGSLMIATWAVTSAQLGSALLWRSSSDDATED